MIEKNLQQVMENINRAAEEARRDPTSIKLVAVTKTFPAATVEQAYAAGITHVGENKLQEAVSKMEAVNAPLNWHFIGHLQTNKVKDVVGRFFMLHSLDRLRLAKELAKWAAKRDTTVRALVQVNTSGEASKYGLPPEDLKDFLIELKNFDNINIQGLMTMAPWAANPEETRPFFRRLRELKEQIDIPGIDLKILSMGMTNDYHVAIEEGANLIRVGTAIFGNRANY